MDGKSEREHVVSFLATQSHSNSALVLGLSSILILMAVGFGYLLLQFKSTATSAANEIEMSSARSSLLLSTYRQAIDAYRLANQIFEQQASQSSLRPLYEQKIDSCSIARAQYLKILGKRSVHKEKLEGSANAFFVQIDSLLANTDFLFTARLLPSGKLNLPKVTKNIFEHDVGDYFTRLRQSRDDVIQDELELSSEEVLQAGTSTRVAAERWFVVSGCLFLFASGLAVVVIFLTGRAASLMRQLKAVVTHSSNPIQITDSAGRVLYVNTEFEKWGGNSGTVAVGSNGLDGVHLLDTSDGGMSAWHIIVKALSKGETWSGEAEVHHRGGNVSFASLIVFPVLDHNGKLVEAVSIFHDTTEKRQLTRKLVETRKQYQKLVESSRDGIVVIQDGKLIFVNPAAVRIFQYDSEEEMRSLSFIDTVAPPSRPFLHLDYLHRTPGEDILKSYEMKGLTKPGKLIDLELDARAIIWNDKLALHASFRDISERKALERQQAVWLWEQETLSSIDRQLLGIVDMHKVLDIILQQIMLLTRSQFVGVAMVDVQSRQGYWRAAKGNRSPLVGNTLTATSDLVATIKSRDHIVVEDCRVGNIFSISELTALVAEEIISAGFFPLAINTELGGMLVIGFRQPHKFVEREIRVLVSMAEKVSIALSSGELYESLVKREKELELLSGARVQAQEEERRRISREIHDGLGQLLTAIKLNLEILEDSLPIQEDAGKKIGEVKQLLDSVLKEAREISYNLMPSVLDDFGLGPGLQSLCEQFSQRSGLRVSFHEHGLTQRLTPDVEIGLYRIVQEALNNVAKHAEAKEVVVQIVRLQNRLRMTIEDDGKGIDSGVATQKPTGSGGTGLVGIRERASSFGGIFVVDSSPGKGTMINVEIPMTEI